MFFSHKVRQGRARKEKSRQDKTWLEKTIQEKTKHDKTRQSHRGKRTFVFFRKGMTRQGKVEKEKTRQDKTINSIEQYLTILQTIVQYCTLHCITFLVIVINPD